MPRRRISLTRRSCRVWLARSMRPLAGAEFAEAKKGPFGHKPQRSQLPGGVVDVHQQGAFWSTPFEPVMVRAIDLHQLPKTSTPFPHRMRLRLFRPLWLLDT